MIRKAVIAAALIASGLAVTGAAARDQFNDKEAVTIDSSKAYILYRLPQKTGLRFLREVTPEERAQWEASRAEALAKAQSKYERALNQYESAMRVYEPQPGISPPVKPKPVDARTFAFPLPEADNFVSVRPGPQFVKGRDEVTYLVAVEPGTYALYGEVFDAPNGTAFGTCLCMGSVTFSARAGEVVDLGAFAFPRRQALEAGVAADSQKMLLTPVLALHPGASGPLPERLKGARVVPAELHAGDKMPNYFGVSISRLAPLDGVLGYDRDKVVDLNAGR